MGKKLYQLDTGWACGGIFVENGTVVGGASIFRKLFGSKLTKLKQVYKVKVTSQFSIIISGSRNGSFTVSDKLFLKSLNPTLVISGGQTGIDTEAKNWAKENGIKYKPFKANWGKYGDSAGPKRNQEMADFLYERGGKKAVVLFPGGSGTNSMKKIAKATGLDTIERKKMDIETSINNIVSDWTGCIACDLYRRRTWQVWGRTVGKLRQGGLVIIGEAPGEEEDRRGEAFVGRSGERLDTLLRDSEIDSVFITNTVLCRPTNNRNPKNKEMKKCFGRLQRFLVTLEPKVIVTAGKVSSNFLLENDSSMGSMVDSVYDWKLGDILSCVILPIYHPSYLIRNNSKKLDGKVAERLKLAWRVINYDGNG